MKKTRKEKKEKKKKTDVEILTRRTLAIKNKLINSLSEIGVKISNIEAITKITHALLNEIAKRENINIEILVENLVVKKPIANDTDPIIAVKINDEEHNLIWIF